MFRVRVNRADNNAFDAGGDDGVRAGRRATLRATRFERYEKRRAARIMAAFLRVAERLDFRVRSAGAPVPAASDDFAAFHQYRAHHWIRRSRAVTAPGEPEG
jgi:hypothetical protein